MVTHSLSRAGSVMSPIPGPNEFLTWALWLRNLDKQEVERLDLARGLMAGIVSVD